MSSVVWMYALMGAFVAGAMAVLGYSLRTGAVADDEAPKYRMLHDEDPERRER